MYDTSSYYSNADQPLRVAIATLFITGKKLFRNQHAFERWLHKSLPGKGKPAIELLATIEGINVLGDELNRLAYGDAV